MHRAGGKRWVVGLVRDAGNDEPTTHHLLPDPSSH
jgi:hypothetical protein